MKYRLNSGDKTSDDSLIVLDEDRLCYRVRSVGPFAYGIFDRQS